MKSYSLSAILLLCLVLVMVDTTAFFGLQTLLAHIVSARWLCFINVVFITVSLSLVLAIIVLKLRLDHIDVKKKQGLISSFYGITVASFVPKIIFVLFIGVFTLSKSVLQPSASVWLVPVLGLLAWLLPFITILYAVFRAVYHFKVYHISVVHTDLPENFNGLRMVQISDLHLGSLNYRYQVLERAVRIINNLKPDILCFTGDLVNNYAWELDGWEDVFLKLDPAIKKYAVLGNHDYGDYSLWKTKADKQANVATVKQFFKTIGFKLLLNEWELLERKDDRLFLMGVENWGIPPFKQYGDLNKSLEGLHPTDFKVLLSHDPTHWSEEVVAHTNIALTLAGHTHGMQAGLRIKSKSWSPIQYKYKHWAGLYKEANQYLYVNRGLGWLGFPGRIGMRPEITALTLKSE